MKAKKRTNALQYTIMSNCFSSLSPTKYCEVYSVNYINIVYGKIKKEFAIKASFFLFAIFKLEKFFVLSCMKNHVATEAAHTYRIVSVCVCGCYTQCI